MAKSIYHTDRNKTLFLEMIFSKRNEDPTKRKNRDNEYDKEAIKVTYEGLGKIGYVANSSYTVIGDSMSAGRLYDKIGEDCLCES